MRSICGADACGKCGRMEECGGCAKTGGRPCGGRCIAAECIKKEGLEAFTRLKNAAIEEFNALGITGLHVEELFLLFGGYINLEYRLANGQAVKLLEDNHVYMGNQIEIPGSERCYGLAADDRHLLVCTYGCGGTNPEIVVYKKR